MILLVSFFYCSRRQVRVAATGVCPGVRVDVVPHCQCGESRVVEDYAQFVVGEAGVHVSPGDGAYAGRSRLRVVG